MLQGRSNWKAPPYDNQRETWRGEIFHLILRDLQDLRDTEDYMYRELGRIRYLLEMKHFKCDGNDGGNNESKPHSPAKSDSNSHDTPRVFIKDFCASKMGCDGDYDGSGKEESNGK